MICPDQGLDLHYQASGEILESMSARLLPISSVGPTGCLLILFSLRTFMSSALWAAITQTKLKKSPLSIELLSDFEVRYGALHDHPCWVC